MGTSLPASTAPSSWTGALAQAAADVARAADELGRSRWASTVRAWCVPYLFHGMEDVFKSGADPTPAMQALFERLAAYLRASKAVGMVSFPTEDRPTGDAVE